MTEAKPNRVCSNCGRANVSPSGRRSTTGRYYCMARACRNAKASDDRSRRMTQEGVAPDAPTECHHCQRSLVPRKVRVNDSPTGFRWCSREACRNARAQTELEWRSGAAVPDPAARAKEALVAEFAVATMTPSATVTCPSCQLASAVEGFIHPTLVEGQLQACTGVGEKGVHANLAKARWPEFFGGDQ